MTGRCQKGVRPASGATNFECNTVANKNHMYAMRFCLDCVAKLIGGSLDEHKNKTVPT